jgi:hypothetical protein
VPFVLLVYGAQHIRNTELGQFGEYALWPRDRIQFGLHRFQVQPEDHVSGKMDHPPYV